MISIRSAASKGIEKIRKPIWAIPEDHIKIDISDGKAGIWVHMFSPFNKECNGKDPVSLLAFSVDIDAEEYEPYTGPVSGSDEYAAAQNRFTGSLKDK